MVVTQFNKAHSEWITERENVHGLNARVPREKLFISKKNKISRLKRAKEFINKNNSFWSAVLFSDENK